MNPRTVAVTEITGGFSFPIGIKFLDSIDHRRKVVVSTVCLDGGHLEDPLGWCSPETGFETMVFIDGCTFFSAYTAKYAARAEAKAGHRDIVKKIYSGELTLSIPMRYWTFDEEESEVKA